MRARPAFVIEVMMGLIAGCLMSVHASAGGVQDADSSNLQIRLVTDEADAVMALLVKHKSGDALREADWLRLYSSEGYLRLKEREEAMERPFSDTDVEDFVLSDTLSAKMESLQNTLLSWTKADLRGAGGRAQAYLPPGAIIRASLYPVIKPKANSFVYDLGKDPAIFLYVDPAKSAEEFENTLAHELHHIGYSESCGATSIAQDSSLSESVRAALDWMGAFGEGFAMLAAAGGPDIHPHRFSAPEERARWDREVANFDADLRRLESFFIDILDDRHPKDKITEDGYSFFGVQGPWYTVGWKMAFTIEKTFGRARLIECICDRRKLLSTYNEAAKENNRTVREPLPLWSVSLIGRISR